MKDSWQKHISAWIFYLQFERKLSQNTREAYENDLWDFYLFLEDSEQQIFAEDVGQDIIQQFIFSPQYSTHAVRTRSRKLSALKSFFKFLVLEKIREDHPCRNIDAPKLDVYFPDYLEIKEIDAMLSAIDKSTYLGERDEMIIELLYGAGLRVSELSGLRLQDIYQEDGLLSVYGKGGKVRIVPLPNHTMKKLKHYLSHVRCQFPEDYKGKELVFLNYRGGAFSRISVFKLIKKLAAAAGIRKNVYPHTLRHSYATHLLKNGTNIRYIQELLGHSSITTTEIYTHIENEELKKTILQCHPRNMKISR